MSKMADTGLSSSQCHVLFVGIMSTRRFGAHACKYCRRFCIFTKEKNIQDRKAVVVTNAICSQLVASYSYSQHIGHL